MIYNSWDVSGAIPSLWGRLYATPYPPLNPGRVNVVMCDGSARSLSDNIDRTVYVKLVTPAGVKQKFAGFLPEDPLSQADY